MKMTRKMRNQMKKTANTLSQAKIATITNLAVVKRS